MLAIKMHVIDKQSVYNCKNEDITDIRIGFWFKTLSKRMKNLGNTQPEYLAVVWNVLLLTPYLERQSFTLRTDQHALRWILHLAEATGKLTRWRLRLLKFDFVIIYLAGIKHRAADGLSLLRRDESDMNKVDGEILVSPIKTKMSLDYSIQKETTEKPLKYKPQEDRTEELLNYTQIDDPEESLSAIEPHPKFALFRKYMYLPTLDEFISAQAKEVFCESARKWVGLPGARTLLTNVFFSTQVVRRQVSSKSSTTQLEADFSVFHTSPDICQTSWWMPYVWLFTTRILLVAHSHRWL